MTAAEFQLRFDATIIQNGVWAGFLGGYAYALDVARDFAAIEPPRMAYAMMAYAGLISLGYFGLAVSAWQAKCAPRLRMLAGMLFTVSVLHSIANLHLARNPIDFGGIVVIILVAGNVLTRILPFLVMCVIGLAGTVPFISEFNPHDVSDTYLAILGAPLLGLTFILARRRSFARKERLRFQSERLREELQTTVANLEREIRERIKSEQRYRSVFENSIVGVFQCAADGRFTLANATMARLLGYESTAALMTTSLLEHNLQEHGARSQSDLKQASKAVAAEGVGLNGGEYVLVRRDGRPVTVVLHAQKISAGNDGAGGYEGLILDITERKSAEASLQQHREQLMHVSRLASLGEMLAAIAHEVHQPLHAIATYAGASAKTLSTCSDPVASKVHHWNVQIAEQAARAGAIIHRLRGFAHNAQPRRTAADLEELINESLALIEPILARYRISTQIEHDRALPGVFIDRVLIEQVFTNLFRNACEAMNDNGELPRQLTVRTTYCGDMVDVAVIDTGVGLGATEGRDIFAAFVSTKPEGLGLGLAISRTIVEGHGGQIWATQNQDRGATLHVALPIGTDEGHVDDGR